jgi:hypothetical protein
VQNARDETPDPPDGAATCATDLCNYQTQDGCADELACRPSFPAGSTTVTPVCEAFGAGQTDDPCETSLDCAKGYLCVQLSAASEDGTTPAVSRCYRQCCSGDWTACDQGTSCIRQFNVQFSDQHVEHPLDLCMPTGTCDLFDPDSCANDPAPPARECKIVDPTGAVGCMPKSSRKLGDTCSIETNGCAQGFTCVLDADSSVDGHCRRLCRAEVCGEPHCPSQEGTCVHFNRDPEGVGECALVSAP